MTHNQIPEGEEREVKTMGGAAIDGATIAHIIVSSICFANANIICSFDW